MTSTVKYIDFFNVGKGPQTNLPISVTAPNTHQWKESSPSFLSPTSTSQSFFHPPSSTVLGDDDIISILSDHSLLVNSFSPSNVSMPSKQANTAYKPEKSKEIQREVETSSLSDVYPLSNIAGQCSTCEFHTRFKTLSNNPEMFQTGFETSSLCHAFPTNARQFHEPLEAIKTPTCMKTVHELLVLHRHELYDLNKIGKVCVALCRDVFFGKRIMAVSTVAGRC